MRMRKVTRDMLAGQIKEHGWDHEGQTVVKFDKATGMYTPIEYEELIANSTKEDLDLTDDLVYNWMSKSGRLN